MSYTLSLHGKHWPQQLPLGALLPVRSDQRRYDGSPKRRQGGAGCAALPVQPLRDERRGGR